MHQVMRTLLGFLSGPEFAFKDVCDFACLDPRRVTVWLQRAHPVRLPVPTGVLMSKRKRAFSSLEVLQLCVLGRLIDNRVDLTTAAVVSESATDHFAHAEELGGPLSKQSVRGIVDLGLFIRPPGEHEAVPSRMRETKLMHEIASIERKFSDGIALLNAGNAPAPFTFVPIGKLAQLLITKIAEKDPECAEAIV